MKELCYSSTEMPSVLSLCRATAGRWKKGEEVRLQENEQKASLSLQAGFSGFFGNRPEPWSLEEECVELNSW